MIPFKEWPKIGRYSRDAVVTEKIDGTNASIYIPEVGEDIGDVPFLIGSRTRWITPEQDNAGFARWAREHEAELLTLGPGHHFGEWWGSGIQRGYGLPKGEKRFSLFNVGRWKDSHGTESFDPEGKKLSAPTCCYVVPIVMTGEFPYVVGEGLKSLEVNGSLAVPGFMKPEGIVIFHTAAGFMFKKTLEGDDKGKNFGA